jgi:hypothetical protein
MFTNDFPEIASLLIQSGADLDLRSQVLLSFGSCSSGSP